MPRSICGIILLCCAVPLQLRAAVMLPLDGYCRAGRYMPVMCDGQAQKLDAGAGMPTRLTTRAAGVAPVLVGPSADHVTATEASVSQVMSIRLLHDDERLVGTSASIQNGSGAKRLFPGSTIIAISLNPIDPLPGPPAAWQSLDAVVLDGAQMKAINDARRSTLLAAGTTLAVEGNTRPDTRWPWVRTGALWTLRATPMGPDNDMIQQEVFDAVPLPNTGLSARDRRLIAVAILLLIAALPLTRLTRHGTILAIALCAISIGGAFIWRRHLPAIIAHQGLVIVRDNHQLSQVDNWAFQGGRVPRRIVESWAGLTRLRAPDSSALAEASPKLLVDPGSGKMAFAYTAMPGRCIAMERSDVLPATRSITSTWLVNLQRQAYAH